MSASSNFIDYTQVYIRSGKGGAGAVHFRREKFIPKGGPDGGNGGNGGSIFLKGNQQLSTLLHLKYKKHIIADNGKPGGKQCSTGTNGKDIIIEVPLGTVVHTEEKKNIISIEKDQQQYLLMKGGRGGLGNVHFKSPQKQTPRFAQSGKQGQEALFIFELKLLADVGLVGFPNAGKSTLLSTVSAAKPAIAPYPFTTLTPQLGIVSYREKYSFVMADIPGLIQKASLGKGLGIRFLRHIEKNTLLLFLISVEEENILQQYHILLSELKHYDDTLLQKKRILVLTKIDLLDEAKQKDLSDNLKKKVSCPIVCISSVTQKGVLDLKDQVFSLLHK